MATPSANGSRHHAAEDASHLGGQGGEASSSGLEHVNVKCLIDGRRFRIAVRHGTSDAFDLGTLRVCDLHRRFAEQTNHAARTFSLHLATASSKANKTLGRPLRGDEVLGLLAKGKRSILIEMAPFDGGRGEYELPLSVIDGVDVAMPAGRSNNSHHDGASSQSRVHAPPRTPPPSSSTNGAANEPTPSASRPHTGAELAADHARPRTPRATKADLDNSALMRREEALLAAESSRASSAAAPAAAPTHDRSHRSESERSRDSSAAWGHQRAASHEHRSASAQQRHADPVAGYASSIAGESENAGSVADRHSAVGSASAHQQRRPPPPQPPTPRGSAAPSRGVSPAQVHPYDGGQQREEHEVSKATVATPPTSRRLGVDAVLGRIQSPQTPGGYADDYDEDVDEQLAAARSDTDSVGSRPRGPEAACGSVHTAHRDDGSRRKHDDPRHGAKQQPSGQRRRRERRGEGSGRVTDADVEQLRYRLEVAEQLLAEDRDAWAAEEAETRAAAGREVQRQLEAWHAEEARLDAQACALRDRLYALQEALDKANNANAEVLEQRNAVQRDVDASADELEARRAQLAKRLAACGCDDDRDAAMIEKLLQIATQKHLYRLQLTDTHERIVKANAALDALRYQRRTLHHTVEEVRGNIRVVVRMRPLQPSDFTAPRHAIRDEEGDLRLDYRDNSVTLNSAATGVRFYEFFKVYGPPEEAETLADVTGDSAAMLGSSIHSGAASSTAAAGTRRDRGRDGGASDGNGEQQRRIFLEQVQPVLQSLADGTNIAVIAYGQTGSGKTHTIFGRGAADRPESGDAPQSNVAAKLSALDGLLPQALESLFAMKAELDHSEATKREAAGAPPLPAEGAMRVRMSMVEVYLSDVYDVLTPAAPVAPPLNTSTRTAPGGGSNGPQASTLVSAGTRCEVRALPSGGAVVVGAREVEVPSYAAAMDTVAKGFAGRKTHRTLTNARSSRSHLILTVFVDVASLHTRTGAVTTRASRMMFVDLAGSERVHRSLSSGDRLKEAQHINRSLSALGDVLAALTARRGAAHVPYRNSKLTHLLQPCIGGDSKTLMFACVCPHVPQRHNLGETACTLAFAARARKVENKQAVPQRTATAR